MAEAPVQKLGSVPAGKVPVIDPDGDLAYLPLDQARAAVAQDGEQGVRIVAPDELHELQLKAEYGNSPVKAGLLGAASGAVPGAEKILTMTGAAEPETLKAIEENNPGSYYTGMAAGMVADPVGIMGGLSKLGVAATKFAAPAIEGAVGRIATKEASPIVNNILKNIGTGAISGTTELGLLGVGDALREDALGNENLNAESVISHMASSATGGMILGGLLHGSGAALSGAIDKAAGSELLGKPLQKIQEYLKGKAALRPEAESFKAIAEAEDLPILPTHVTNDPLVRKMTDAVSNSQGEIGHAMRDAETKAYTGVSDRIGQYSGVTTENGKVMGDRVSAHEAGQGLQDAFAGQSMQEKARFEKAYGDVNAVTGGVPLKPTIMNETGEIIEHDLGNFANKLGDELTKGVAPNSPFAKAVRGFTDYMKGLESLEQFSELRSVPNLKKSLGLDVDAATRGRIAGAMQDFEVAQLEKAANALPDGLQRNQLLQTVGDLKSVRKEYSKFKDEFGSLMKTLFGERTRVGGAGDIYDRISNMEPATLIKKLGNAGIERMGELSARFPEEMGAFKEFQKQELVKSATKDGKIDPNLFFKKLEKLDKEERAFLYSKEELDRLNGLKHYMEGFRPGFKPLREHDSSGFPFGIHDKSGTLGAIVGGAMGHATGIPGGGIAGAIVGGKALTPVIDGLMIQGIQHLTSDAAGRTLKSLQTIENAQSKTVSNIVSKSKAIFDTTKSAVKAVAPAAEQGLKAGVLIHGREQDDKETREKFEKVSDQIREAASDAGTLTDKVTESTAALFPHAPKTTQAIQQRAVMMAGFLNSKLPQTKETFFGGKQEPSMSDIYKFNQYYSTAKEPTSVLTHIANGTLLPAHIETVRNVFPEINSAMMNHLTEQLVDFKNKKKKENMPYSRQLALAMFMGGDMVQSASPQSIMQYQSSISQQSPEEQGQQDGSVNPTQSGLAKIDSSSRMMTGTQTVANREKA